jgi:hypothetical protein
MRVFLIFVFSILAIGCSADTGPISYLDNPDGGAVDPWSGTGGAAGGLEPAAGAGGGAAGAGGGAAGEGHIVGGTGGKPAAGASGAPGPEDAGTGATDAQEPLQDAGEQLDAAEGEDAAADAGEPLGTQCEQCAVLGPDGGFQYFLECEEGYNCLRIAVGAERAYCLQYTSTGVSSEAIECGEGLFEFPDGPPTTLGQVCKPVSGSCDLWLQQYGS